MRYLIFPAVLFLTLFSCNQSDRKTHIQYGVYHWASYLDAYAIKDCIQESPIRNYYIRFFDLKWNPIIGAYPEAKIYGGIDRLKNFIEYKQSDSIQQVQISPVVYLTQEVLINSDTSTLKELASNTIQQINYTLKEMGRPSVRELQIDCDWTESTKEKYFYYLRELKRHWTQTISVTVKMYQYKYREKAGIPPVDKAVLMCYNLQSPKDYKVVNSIFTLKEFKKYMNRSDYPLPLDFAVPAFSWVRVFANGELQGVLNDWYLKDFEGGENYEKIESNRFRVIKDHTTFGQYWRKGTLLIIESVDSLDWVNMIEAFKPHYNQDTTTIIAYQIEEPEFENFKKYSFTADSLSRLSQ